MAIIGSGDTEKKSGGLNLGKMSGASLKDRWADMAPNAKKKVMFVGVIVFVFALSALMLLVGGGAGSGTTASKQGAVNDASVPSSLIPNDSQNLDIGNSAIAQDVTTTRSDMQKLSEQVRRLQEENQQMRNAGASGELGGRDAQIMQRLEQLSGEMQALKTQQPAPQQVAPGEVQGEYVEEQLPAGYGGIKVIRDTKAGPGGPSADGGGSASTDGAEGKTDAAVAGETAARAERLGMYLPSGSIVTGVLISGLDAPTGKGAMKDPVPVLIRVKKEAILPSRFTADIRECFILASGSGDLPSERAYLRTESVSCITRDKQVIDMKMQGYAVDSDGKAGLRGRLVSKQGSALAKGIIAAFAEGVSKAFAGQDRVAFGGAQPIDWGQAGQSSAVMGASSALDRVAKYYLDLADTLHPILEIDAGRPVSLILIKGQELGTVN